MLGQIMGEEKGRVRKFAAFLDLFERAAHWWPVVVAVGSGGVVGWAAHATKWLNDYGPISWVIAALLGSMFVLGCYWLIATIRVKAALASYTTKRSNAYSVNVLASVHDHERMNLTQFSHPYLRPTENVRFADCELMGPALVFLNGCTLKECRMEQCEVVILGQDVGSIGMTQFNFCSFLRCSFYRVTWLMHRKAYDDFPEDSRSAMRVISDGSTPNI